MWAGAGGTSPYGYRIGGRVCRRWPYFAQMGGSSPHRDFAQRMAQALSNHPDSVLYAINLAGNQLEDRGTQLLGQDEFSPMKTDVQLWIPPSAAVAQGGTDTRLRWHGRLGLSVLPSGIIAFSRHVEKSPKGLQSLSLARTMLTAKGTAPHPAPCLGAVGRLGTAVLGDELAPKGWLEGLQGRPGKGIFKDAMSCSPS